MDITIRVSPRRIERAVFILIIVALVVSSIYFYSRQGPVQETEEPIAEQQETQEQEPEEEQEPETTTPDTTDTQDPVDTTTGDCTSGWACKTPYYRGYQKSDCSWESIEACIDGCEDGDCNVVEE